MSDIWLAIPTANPIQCAACFAQWAAKGYKTAALVDGEMEQVPNADLTVRIPTWLGYPHAVKAICDVVLKQYPDVRYVVAAGDDMEPPALPAQQIAEECDEHFRSSTLCVMQATGDPAGVDASGKRAAERICGSPWMGREFIETWNCGQGPFWPGYGHFFADEECKLVTESAGILWQRPGLTILHNHWSFRGKPRPAYMEKASAKWAQDEALFRQRKAAGFPNHQPLQASLSI